MNFSATREYLDYYEKYKIIPVPTLSDLKITALKQQRFGFYYKVGITPNDFMNKEVLELCPGTGINSYYLLKFTKVKHITLVDNNSSSIKEIKKILKDFNNKTIINEDIKKVKIKKKYDYVIMENALIGFENENTIFNKIYNFVKPGGCLVLTTTDEIALLSEKMRFLYSQIIINKNNLYKKSFNIKVELLAKVFKSHLNTLQAKTKTPKKWVQDNMLNYQMIQKNKYFSLPDLIKIIKKRKLIVKSQSPNFCIDYQWYKKFKIQKHNQNIIKNYKSERINFLDFEQKFNSEDYVKKNKIINKIIFVNKLINKMSTEKIEKSYIFKILNELNKISSSLNSLEKNNKISLAINDFIKSLKKYFKSGKLNTNEFKVFKTFWGHATCQNSLLKY